MLYLIVPKQQQMTPLNSIRGLPVLNNKTLYNILVINYIKVNVSSGLSGNSLYAFLFGKHM